MTTTYRTSCNVFFMIIAVMQWSLVSLTKFAFEINAVKSYHVAKENAEKISGSELSSQVTQVSAYSRSHAGPSPFYNTRAD